MTPHSGNNYRKGNGSKEFLKLRQSVDQNKGFPLCPSAAGEVHMMYI
jgi:hypothetical protein